MGMRKYDTKRKELNINCVGDINIKATGSITLTSASINFNEGV